MTNLCDDIPRELFFDEFHCNSKIENSTHSSTGSNDEDVFQIQVCISFQLKNYKHIHSVTCLQLFEIDMSYTCNGFSIKQTCTTYRPQNTNLCLNVLFFWWTLRPCERRLYYKNLHGYNDVMVIVNKHWWSRRVRFNRVWLYLLGFSSQFRLCPFCEALARSLICCCIDSR